MATTSVLGGIHVDVYGLDKLSQDANKKLVVLFLLHGRGGNASEARTVEWCQKLLKASEGASKDLVVVAFDQRNHGRRAADLKRNSGWNDRFEGEPYHNETFAVDCFANQYGTSRDVSFMIDLLPAHLFPNDERCVSEWWCCGISLGGHATWLVLAHEPRVTLGLPVIGSPDMHTLFGRRAAGQQLKVGPPLFPDSFVTLLKKQDPCNVPLSSYKGKRIFALSGEQDTLVNFVVGGSEDFVAKLKHEGVNVQVFIDKAAGHEFSEAMISKAAEYLKAELSR